MGGWLSCATSSRARSCSTSATTCGVRSSQEAHRLEAEGHKILKLNIGNTAPFGFEAPEAILVDMVHEPARLAGLLRLPRHLLRAHRRRAVLPVPRPDRDRPVDDVFIGNGVSELISMVLTAFVDDGNEILVPAPDYPLWTGAVSLAGGTPVHYRCDEANGWNPDLEDIESKITENTYAIVIINPNNPTGAVYSEDIVRGLVDIARRHELVVMADEIYEKIIFDERTSTTTRRAYCRRRRPLPDLQRAVQGLPGLRVPLRLGDDLRPAAPRHRLPRGAHPARQHADVRQRARRSTRSRRRSAATSRSTS